MTTFLEPIDESTAPTAVAEYFATQRVLWGFLPNYAQCFAARPDIANAWASLNGAIRGGMDRRRYEIATIAAARQRRSTYCTIAHASFLRDACSDEATVRAIAMDPTGSLLDDTDRLIYRFAGKVAADPASVTQQDVDDLRAVGLGDDDIANIVYAVAARLFFASVLDGLGAQLDPETADTFDADVRNALVVGRPIGEGRA